jgi:hypothetical protein
LALFPVIERTIDGGVPDASVKKKNQISFYLCSLGSFTLIVRTFLHFTFLLGSFAYLVCPHFDQCNLLALRGLSPVKKLKTYIRCYFIWGKAPMGLEIAIISGVSTRLQRGPQRKSKLKIDPHK